MRVRVAALMAVLALVVTACGARLTDEQRNFAIQAAQGSGSTTGTGTTAPSGNTTSGSGAATGPGAVTGGGSTQAAGPSGGGGSSTGSSGGGTSGGGGTTGSGGQSAGAGQCQGAGGATDTGVTADTIKLATIYNGTGPQPGIFNSAYQATQAAAAYFNSEGGICGRQVKIDAIDDHTNTSDNRAATQQACSQDFAIVGSMSAFDDGGPSVAEHCGIPDMPAIPVTPPHQLEKNILHAAYPNRPDEFIIGYGNYIKKHYPDAIKHAAILWLNASATRSNADARRRAYESIGFHFDVKQEVQITEPDYTPYVAEMRQQGIQYVTMVADYQSISRLNKAMQQQAWFPEVRDWDSVVYDPRFIEQTGPAADGSLFYLDTAMFEEASGNPEMRLYEYWLNKASPGAQPTYFGMYAWSAARLFQKAATAVGGKLTRQALLSELDTIHSWDDYGMHAAHDPGRELPSNCIMYGKIQNGKFVRVFPSSGFSCNMGGLLHQSVG